MNIETVIVAACTGCALVYIILRFARAVRKRGCACQGEQCKSCMNKSGSCSDNLSPLQPASHKSADR